MRKFIHRFEAELIRECGGKVRFEIDWAGSRKSIFGEALTIIKNNIVSNLNIGI